MYIGIALINDYEFMNNLLLLSTYQVFTKYHKTFYAPKLYSKIYIHYTNIPTYRIYWTFGTTGPHQNGEDHKTKTIL